MSSAGGHFAPGRLWSLWDIMHKIKPGFFKALGTANVIHQAFNDPPAGFRAMRMSEGDHAEQLRLITVLKDECLELGLTGAAAVIERGIIAWNAARVVIEPRGKFLEFDYPLADKVKTALSQATSRIPDDLETQVCLALDQRRAHLYQDTRPFGDGVFDAFPSARADIEEAAKCLALERGTACVFHIMRALESAATVIANKIDAAIKDKHGRGLPWGIIADNMKPKIDLMTKGSDEQIQWYRVQQDLVVINRAWRVPTNHPKESYSPEEAQEIFDATKAFMRELAPLA